MKALLIDPVAKALTQIELVSPEEISKQIGFETIIADDIEGTTDQLYFDENCFIRGTEGRFQLDSLPPVAGKAMVVGAINDTGSIELEMTIETLQSRIRFI